MHHPDVKRGDALVDGVDTVAVGLDGGSELGADRGSLMHGVIQYIAGNTGQQDEAEQGGSRQDRDGRTTALSSEGASDVARDLAGDGGGVPGRDAGDREFVETGFDIGCAPGWSVPVTGGGRGTW